MSRKKIYICSSVAFISVAAVIATSIMSRVSAADDVQSYIAHGGGSIDGNVTTNTLESVEHVIDKGVKYIELDLQLTSDGRLVATHDWDTFNRDTGRDTARGRVPTYDEFAACRILGRYTPLTYEMIDSVFMSHLDISLVTDKIKDVGVLDRHLAGLKDRMLVECFSPAQYDECVRLGYTPMRSYHNLAPGGLNVVKSRCARYFYQQFLPTRYAVFENRVMTVCDADSLFESDPRIKFVYVDVFD